MESIGWLTFVANQPIFFMILTINGKQATLKKGSSIEYVSENRIFTDADDYSMEIELPLAEKRTLRIPAAAVYP